MSETNSFEILFDNYDENIMEYYDYELDQIETGMRVLFNERNVNITKIHINSGGYEDRLNWREKTRCCYIYHICNDKIIIKEKHPDLSKDTFFSFTPPPNIVKTDYMSYVNLIYEYVDYVKDLDFCEIYSYQYIEIKDDNIFVQMNSESG